ncbi:glutathione S-transferase family protein [Ideonella sp. YS5]|uniref:glutathione S-transferase family protein n=1 Tax=Ideonella sp. YS5 TaxID=3453714 RepID=UPI003EE83D81
MNVANDDVPSGNTWTRQIDPDGAFARQPTGFHAEIGHEPDAAHPAEPGRYHLYVSLACPWAHRTLIVRALKGLEQVVSVDVVHPHLTAHGWSFDADFRGATGDTVGKRALLREAYVAADPLFNGVVTVPVLWDKRLGTIVNNESAEIVRMLNGRFQPWARHPEVDLYPARLRSAIDEVNAWVYADINNGVYRSGFARSQKAHDSAIERLFAALDRVESILARQEFLCGDVLTEADVRLFVTLIRFDTVYHTHFKCNRRTVLQSPVLVRYMAGIYRLPGVAATVDLDHVRHHYYGSHKHINPSGLIPQGPDVLAALTAAPGPQPIP